MTSLPVSDLSILIIEPSITTARFIEKQLKSLNVRRIEYSTSGSEALNSMTRNTPDLVIGSMYLPDMTATKLVETMRQDRRLKDIPFMLVTTETSFAKLDPIRQAGIIAILPKPFSTNNLRKALVGTTRFIDVIKHEKDHSDFSDIKVLVVDDSLLARKFVTGILAKVGIKKITEAEDGNKAVEILDRQIFDLVITDYNMPEMDGEKLTRYIREKSLQQEIPILMVTSEEKESRLAAVQQAGVSGICNKPFDADTVIKMLRNIRAHS